MSMMMAQQQNFDLGDILNNFAEPPIFAEDDNFTDILNNSTEPLNFAEDGDMFNNLAEDGDILIQRSSRLLFITFFPFSNWRTIHDSAAYHEDAENYAYPLHTWVCTQENLADFASITLWIGSSLATVCMGRRYTTLPSTGLSEKFFKMPCSEFRRKKDWTWSSY